MSIVKKSTSAFYSTKVNNKLSHEYDKLSAIAEKLAVQIDDDELQQKAQNVAKSLHIVAIQYQLILDNDEQQIANIEKTKQKIALLNKLVAKHERRITEQATSATSAK